MTPTAVELLRQLQQAREADQRTRLTAAMGRTR